MDDDEIDLEIERLAEQTGESPRRVRSQMEKEDLLETLAAQLIERKALDLILESAKYEDVPMHPETGLASVEQQAVEGEMKDPTEAPPEAPRRRRPRARPKIRPTRHSVICGTSLLSRRGIRTAQESRPTNQSTPWHQPLPAPVQ